VQRLKKKIEKRDKKLEVYKKEVRRVRAIEHDRLKHFKLGGQKIDIYLKQTW